MSACNAQWTRPMPFAARCCLVFVAIAAGASAQEQEQEPAPISWAYGPYFGTGYYELATGEETYVISARPGWRWREAELGEDARRIGVEFRVPIAVGVYSIDPEDLASTVSFDNVSTLSVVPGIEIEVPIGPRWSIKPLAYVGYGTRFNGDESSWIYWTGIKSRLTFGDDDFAWSMINALTYVGYSASNDYDGSAIPMLTAFEFDRPLGEKKIGGKPVRLHWHVGYTNYRNEQRFTALAPEVMRTDLPDEWEVGAAFSTGAEPLRLWRLKWDRVGLAYRFDSDGDFRGIGLVFRSLFDR